MTTTHQRQAPASAGVPSFGTSGAVSLRGGATAPAYGEPVAPVRYLSRKQVAEMIGVKPDTLGRYRLPPPDAIVGDVRGWLPETISEWQRDRPGRGGTRL